MHFWVSTSSKNSLIGKLKYNIELCEIPIYNINLYIFYCNVGIAMLRKDWCLYPVANFWTNHQAVTDK